MSQFLKQSTAVTIMFGPFVDKTDGVTLETGAGIITSIDHATTGIFLSKNGAAAAIRSQAVTAYGMFKVTLSTTDTNTVGTLDVLMAEAATFLPVHKSFMVLPANVFDSLMGTDLLDINAAQWLGTAILAPGVAGTPDVNAKLIGGTAQTANDIGADVNDILVDTGTTLDGKLDTIDDFLDTEIAAILAAVDTEVASILEDTAVIGALGAGLTAIPWNSAWDAEVQSECADALNAYDPPTKAELDAGIADVSVDELQASALADLFNTDSLTTYAAAIAGSPVKEIADNAGGSALTEGGIADAVWDELKAGHAIADSFGDYLDTAVSGVGGGSLTEEGIADAVWNEDVTAHENALTAGRIQSAKFGAWEITGNQLICKGLSGNVLFTFNLTQDGIATEYNPDLRTPV